MKVRQKLTQDPLVRSASFQKLIFLESRTSIYCPICLVGLKVVLNMVFLWGVCRRSLSLAGCS